LRGNKANEHSFLVSETFKASPNTSIFPCFLVTILITLLPASDVQGVSTIMSIDRKLVNFDANHHETLHVSYREKMKWWHNETEVERRRCKTCWLRSHQCYCETLTKKRESYEKISPKPNVNVCIYYNPVEIGRSANTAHSLEATCPFICNSIIYGDLEKETALLDEIEAEYKNNALQTCIMFPCNEAKLLSEWMGGRPATMSEKPIRLVMLDGTFPGASRQAKFLMNCCALRGVPAPLVKLDLEDGACKSAMMGIMHPPGKDKICTLQATVMAMQQAKVDPVFCQSLFDDLNDWIKYILKAKVKLGKTKEKTCMKYVMDVTPTELVVELLVSIVNRNYTD
jgi:DTW domain-containing protein YfiP